MVRALAAYQNPDGGFGHGLEADCLNPHSSPIQTWCATGQLRAVDLWDRDHPVVEGIIGYLESRQDFDGRCWVWAVPSNNDHPHAPWWTWQPEQPRTYNPTAALAGWLYRVTGSDFSQWLVREAMVAYLDGGPCLDMHLLPCFLQLYRDLRASAPAGWDLTSMEAKLRRDIAACVRPVQDGYCARPSDYILGRDDPFLSCIPDLAEQECSIILETQAPSGAWPIPWTWGGMYPDDYAVSANWWRSGMILKNLLYLRGMGAIDV